MVGVAGKSKACGDCKRRRVKCGFERPGCLRCSRARIQCSGYSKEVFFINRTVSQPSVSAPIALAKCGPPRATPYTIENELDKLLEHSRAVSKVPLAFRAQVFRFLQKLYLPEPAFAENDPSTGAPLSWVKAVCGIETADEALDRTLAAFCEVQVYLTRSDKVSHSQALESYNEALGILSNTLTGDTVPNYACTLASIVVLSTSELFLCPTDDGWRAHVQGIAGLLRQRQSQSLRHAQTAMCWKLCSRIRVMSVLSQLTRRRMNSLSASQWGELMPDLTNIDPLDQLMDIICELPAIYEAADLLVATGDTSEPQRLAVIAALIHTMSNIYTWHAELRQASPGPLHTTVPPQLTNPVDEASTSKLFPFAIQFRSIQVACYFVVSWGVLLQAHASLLQLSAHFGQKTIHKLDIDSLLAQCGSIGEENERNLRAEISMLPPGSIKDEADRLARYLCQSVEYCHRIEMGTFGPQMMCYSNWILWSYYRQVGAERELQWCLNMKNMHGAPTRCGTELMSFQG